MPRGSGSSVLDSPVSQNQRARKTGGWKSPLAGRARGGAPRDRAKESHKESGTNYARSMQGYTGHGTSCVHFPHGGVPPPLLGPYGPKAHRTAAPRWLSCGLFFCDRESSGADSDAEQSRPKVVGEFDWEKFWGVIGAWAIAIRTIYVRHPSMAQTVKSQS